MKSLETKPPRSLFRPILTVPVHTPVFAVIPAKGGIQYAGLACLAPDWIPAFAGMTMPTLISRLQTGSCPRERLFST